jgi:hypothetical protein
MLIQKYVLTLFYYFFLAFHQVKNKKSEQVREISVEELHLPLSYLQSLRSLDTHI